MPSPAPADPQPASRTARLVELDGLRGLAAVVVVIHHMLLTVPALAEVGSRPRDMPRPPLAMVLGQTPLHVVWLGHEAVIIFFILSGVALTHPIARTHAQGRRFDWVDYVPRRLIRLWLPAAAATILTALSVLAVPRSGDPALGIWITDRMQDLDAPQLLRQLLLLPRHSYHNSVLWSLHAEALFSFLLPLVVIVVALAAACRAWWLPVPAALVLPMVTAEAGTGVYLPVFTVGAVLGWRWGHMDSPLPARTAPWATPVALACLLLLTVMWWPGLEAREVQRLTIPLMLSAAALLVALSVQAGALRTVLRSGAVQYLGAISFSLYLVHEPIIVTLRLLTASWSPWWMLVLAPPVIAPLTWLFHRWVEAPSHRLSRHVGRMSSRRLRALRPPAQAPGGGRS